MLNITEKRKQFIQQAEVKESVEKAVGEVFALVFGVTVDTNRETREQMLREAKAQVAFINVQLESVLTTLVDSTLTAPEDTANQDSEAPEKEALLDVKLAWSKPKSIQGVIAILDGVISSDGHLTIRMQDGLHREFIFTHHQLMELVNFKTVSPDAVNFFQVVE